MYEEGRFATHDGEELFECRWLPEQPLRAHLVLIHGYGEYCGRYAHVAAAFNAAGISVHAYDQRGYGRSPGRRAYIHDFDVLMADLDAYLAHVAPQLEDAPRFMMGHSMGGLVLATHAVTKEVQAQGLVFSSPFLAFPDDVPKILLAVAPTLGTLLPCLPVGGVDNTGLSRDPEVVAAADADPLSYHGWVRARTGAEFDRAIRRVHANAGQATKPMLVIHGSDDKVVSCRGSRSFYENAGAEDKSFTLYEGGYHELWNDLDKDRAIAQMRDWIIERA